MNGVTLNRIWISFSFAKHLAGESVRETSAGVFKEVPEKNKGINLYRHDVAVIINLTKGKGFPQ